MSSQLITITAELCSRSAGIRDHVDLESAITMSRNMQEGLLVRMRVRRRRRISLHRGPTPLATRRGEYWAMDFVHDQLQNGRRLRVLTVLDKWHRECVAFQADFAQTGQSVVDALEEISVTHELPYAITVDQGTEFTSKALDERCYRRARVDGAPKPRLSGDERGFLFTSDPLTV